MAWQCSQWEQVSGAARPQRPMMLPLAQWLSHFNDLAVPSVGTGHRLTGVVFMSGASNNAPPGSSLQQPRIQSSSGVMEQLYDFKTGY